MLQQNKPVCLSGPSISAEFNYTMVTIDIGLGFKLFQVTNASAYFVKLYFTKKKVLKLVANVIFFSFSQILLTNKLERLSRQTFFDLGQEPTIIYVGTGITCK
jgi:hypothetical protein